MSTIGSLLLAMDPGIRPWSQGMQDVNREQVGRQQAQTGLIELARLKQAQASEAEVMAAIQRDPSLQALLFGGSTLGALPPAGAPGGMPPAGPGPITQSPLGGGPAQQIPAYPDASRYAGVSPQGGGPIPPDVLAQTMPTVTPPQGTIASLGPPPQGQMPGPQNPVLEMARRDPRAALMLQQQMQTQQDRQWKMQEQQLGMGVKVAEFVARELQGVTDQASLDQARERIRQVHPQAAAQVPQMYSQEAVASVQQRGIAIAERANTQLAEAKARNLDMETRMFPELAKRFGMEGDGQAPAGGAAPTTGTPSRTAPPEFESAMTEANRLYPQVSIPRIKSIIAAESNFDAKAVSSAGAKGPMQLMDTTAKEMGVDDPFNVQQNVRGGTRYYAQMLARYGGDERKALAAYNWGPGNLDKVGGDVSKAPAETQAYVQRVLGGGVGGGGGTAQAPTADPRIAQYDAKIAQRTRDAQIASLMKNESLSTRLNDDANRLTAEKNRLLEESRRQQERSTEIPRALEKETALQPLKIAQQRAGAEVQREAKQYEPIGTQAADELDLPASTLWKDVPKDRKPMPRPGEGERNALSGLRASVAGVDSLLTKLDDPKIASMVGTIFTEPPAAVNRLLGPWLATLPPEQRAFAATMAGEIMEIRHRLIGAGQTGIEVAALEPMMPSPADTDPATVRAKLTALREGMLRRHNAKRDDLAGMGYRVPDKLAPPPASASGLSPDQQRLLDKHTTR